LGTKLAIHHLNQATSRGARMLRTALGPAIALWLEDASVVEVMLNPDGRRTVRKSGRFKQCLISLGKSWLATQR